MNISVLISFTAILAAVIAGWRATSYAESMIWNIVIATMAAFVTLFFFGDMRTFGQSLIADAISAAIMTGIPNTVAYVVAREHRRYRTSNQA